MRVLMRAFSVALIMALELTLAMPVALLATPASAALGDFCFIGSTTPGELGPDDECVPNSTIEEGDQCGTSELFFNLAANQCVANNAQCSTGTGPGLYSGGVCQALPTPAAPAVPSSPTGFTVDPNANTTPTGEMQPMCVNASPFIGGGLFVVSGTVLCYTGAGRDMSIYAYSETENSGGWNPLDPSAWDSLALRDLYASDDITAVGTLSAFGGAQLYSLNGLNGVQVNDSGVLVRSADLDGNVASLATTPGNIVASATDGTSTSSLAISGGAGISLTGEVASGGPAVSIHGAIGSNSNAAAGVVISGDGQGSAAAPTSGPASWADVQVASKSYAPNNGLGSAVIVNDYGVTVKSAALGNSYNSFGGAGAVGSMVTNEIGTGNGGGATTNIIGNTNAQSSFQAYGGNSSMVVVQGALDFSTSGGPSVFTDATQQVAGGSSTVMAGSSARHVVVDGNGRMTVINGVAGEANSSMHITNGYGVTNGVMVNEHTAAISGGTSNPTTLSLTDNGMHISGANGAPTSFSGVADGQGAFDAVNLRQLDGGIASIAALAGIPSPQLGKNNSIGIGMGTHGSGTALALGGQSLIGDSFSIKYGASVSYSGGLVDTSTMMGIGMSW